MKKQRRRRGKADATTTFIGLALVRPGEHGGTETLIVSDRRSAKHLDLDAAEMRLVRAALAAGPVTGKCRSQKNGQGGIRCAQGSCTGQCHLFRAKRPLDPEKPKIEDLGPMFPFYHQMEEEYGYWCDCV